MSNYSKVKFLKLNLQLSQGDVTAMATCALTITKNIKHRHYKFSKLFLSGDKKILFNEKNMA